jgi:hydroxyacid-oxoacid transhydrogenase
MYLCTDPRFAILTNRLMCCIVKTVIESLKKHHVNFSVYSQVRVEPTDSSFKQAIDFAISGDFDAFVAVGGGSVIDTCKAANLYSSYPPPRDPESSNDNEQYDFLYYVNPPIGKGKPPPGPLKPLIAIPTTVCNSSGSSESL